MWGRSKRTVSCGRGGQPGSGFCKVLWGDGKKVWGRALLRLQAVLAWTVELLVRESWIGGWQWHPTPALLPGKSHGRRSLVGCSPWGRYELDTTERLHFHFSLSCIGEGNGNPLQCSCLVNPRDGGAWWAAVSGVAQSWTRLKRLSSSSNSSNLCLMLNAEDLELNYMLYLGVPAHISRLKPVVEQVELWWFPQIFGMGQIFFLREKSILLMSF